MSIKTVLWRIDANVPISRGRITDDSRLRALLPSLEHLLSLGVRVVALSHFGRPNGRSERGLSLQPVARWFAEQLGRPVDFFRPKDFEQGGKSLTQLKKEIDLLPPSSLSLMENLRFYKGEEEASLEFARALASLGDRLVFDAFAVAHRVAASTTVLPEIIPTKAGELLKAEIKGLGKILKPKSPFVAIVGGTKIETKLPLLTFLIKKSQVVAVGGGIANTLFYAKGYGVGASLFDKKYVSTAVKLLKAKNLFLPLDVVVAPKNRPRAARVVVIRDVKKNICAKNEMILDIGPETVRAWAPLMKSAKTILWNGAVGMFEKMPFNVGTDAIARLMSTVSQGRAFGVAGGGETLFALARLGLLDEVDFVSTGGGAMLDYVASGGRLPGLRFMRRLWFSHKF